MKYQTVTVVIWTFYGLSILLATKSLWFGPVVVLLGFWAAWRTMEA